MILRGTVFSKTLGMETGLTIVAPETPPPAGGYKAAYLLHGLGGGSGTWADCSMLPVYGEKGSAVYILPDAGRSFYRNMVHGFPYFTYLTEELPDICKNLFQISARREDTAVIGCSMGGYGALLCALSRPDRYGMCGAFSAGWLFLGEVLTGWRNRDPRLLARFGERMVKDVADIFGESLEWKPEYELLELAGGLRDACQKPSIYMACGKSDPYRKENERFWQGLQGLGVDCLYEEWAGMHDFSFFDEALKRAVKKFSL